MEDHLNWAKRFKLDVDFGYVGGDEAGTGAFAPPFGAE
jgi:hypothetical protein